MIEKINDRTFKKVLFIGPDLNGKGGIASVLKSYENNFQPFNYLSTNKSDRRFAGYLQALLTAARLPFARLKGRKIVHIHYATGKSWKRKVILMHWARLFGYKVIMHCHGAEMHHFSKKIGYHKVKKTLDKASANIVLSRRWVDFFNENFKTAPLYAVNNIVDMPGTDADTGRHTPVTFLFMGELGHRKGIFDLLEAFAALRDQGLEFRLIVGGNGETDRFKNEVKRLDLERFVDFRGWIGHQAKEEAFGESDVLVLPSRNEGLPIAVLEAMARGKGIVTTPVGGIPEVISDNRNGYLVTPGDVAEISAALRKYIESPETAAEHGKESQNVIRAFYPGTVAGQLTDIYRNVLE